MPYQFRIMANFADVYLNENAENCIKTYKIGERTMKILERKGDVGSFEFSRSAFEIYSCV